MIEFDKTEEVRKAVEKATGVALLEVALIIHSASKNLSPVDTGLLKGSLSYSADRNNVEGYEDPANAGDAVHKSSKDEAVIGTNVHYAPYLEYGTVKMAAQPYLRKAADNNKKTVSDKVGKTYRMAIKAVTG